MIVTMYSSDKNINNIMISLNHDFAIFISKWFYKNFMVLNPDKCSFMLLYFLLTLNLLSNNVTIKITKMKKYWESSLMTNFTSPRILLALPKR